MTGPIQPLPIPNVAPGYFQPGPSSVDIIHRGVKSLVDVLLAKQGQDFEQQKLNEQIAQRQQQQAIDTQTGDLLQQLLPALARPSVPGIQGGTVGPVAGMIAPVTVQPRAPDTVETKLTSAFANKPGTVIRQAAGIGANAIQQAIARETLQFTPKPVKATGEGLEHYVNDKGELLVLNKTTRQANPVIDSRTGLPVMAPKPDPTVKPRWTMTSWTTPEGHPTQINAATGEIREAPAGLIKQGPIGASQDAAFFYREAAQSWHQIAELGPKAVIPGDAANFILGVRGALGTGPAEKFIRESSLSDETKRAMLAWVTIIRGSIYSKSGKAVTLQEFQDALNRGIPTGLDSDKLRQSKSDILQTYTEGLYGKSLQQFNNERQQGLDTPPAPAELFQSVNPAIHRQVTDPNELRAIQ